ncbi:MAG: ABC transporter substrate-binding protein [Deltaproteobacteria bacterium]|nr:ABC transporter substrate-binding protein [Deltaproteobacteria bacterium]
MKRKLLFSAFGPVTTVLASVVLGTSPSLVAASASAEGGATRIVFASGSDGSGTVQRSIEEFNASHAGRIQVTWRQMDPSNDVHHRQLLADLAAGEVPQVIASDVVWTAELARHGWVEDLTRRFYGAYDRDAFLGPALQSATWRLRIWGVPWYTDAGVLFYRRDLLAQSGFEAPPRTWDELARVARQVQGDSGIRHGFVFQGAEYEGGTVNAAEYIWGAGGEIMRGELRITSPLRGTVVETDAITIDSEEAAQGLDMARRMIVEGITPAEVATFREQEALDVFLSGNAVFLRSWPYVHALLEGAALPEAAVGVAPLPALSAERAGTSCLGGWNLMVSARADDEEQDAAWELIRYLTSAEQQKRRALEAGLLPVLVTLYEDPEVLARAPVVALARETMSARVRVRPMSPFYPEMSSRIASAFHAVLEGDLTGSQAVERLDVELRDIAVRNR